MKLTLITTDINIFGGIERVISILMNKLSENDKYTIEILSLYSNSNKSPSFNMSKKIKINHCNIKRIKYNTRNKIETLIYLLISYIKLKKDIFKILKDRDDDLILTFHTPISIATILNKRNINGKIIVSEHSDYYNLPDKLAKILRRAVFKNADKVVILTGSSKKIYKEFCNNISVIPNPIEYSINEIPKCTNNRILCAGRLSKEKGFDRVITIFNLISEKNEKWELNIFGEGEEKDNLLKIIKDYGLENRVKIYPFTKNLKEEMLKSDIYIIGSRSEAFPMVLIEAMECGLAPISFELTGPSEMLKDSYDGLLVENNNIELFAHKLEWLINNEEHRSYICKNAKNTVKKYNIELVIKRWESLFDEMMIKQ